MGSVLTIAALVVVLGFAFGGWAVFTVGSATDDALERDERDISRGRHSDNDDN